MGGVVARLDRRLEFAGGLGEIVERQPAIGGEPVTDVAGGKQGAVDIGHQAVGHRLFRIDIEPGQIVGDILQQRHFGIGGFGKASMPGPQDAQRAFGPLDVTAKPEKIVGGPARQAAGHDADEAFFRRQKRHLFDGFLADDPDVGGRATGLHGDGGGVGTGANARKAAGHHLPAVAGAGDIDAQAHRPRRQLAVDPGGRGGEGDDFLADEFRAVGLQPFCNGCLGGIAQRRAKHGLAVIVKERPGGIGRADDHLLDIARYLITFRLLAAPPCGDAWQHGIFAKQMTADGWHEREEGAGFEDAGAERIDDRDRAGAQRFDNAGGADMRALVQFQRIGKGGIETAPEHADGFQTSDGADHDAAIDHRQVFTFQQHEAEIAGDIGVFEIGLVGDARRQNGDAVVRMFLARLQFVAEGTEEAREAVDMGFGIEIGKGAGGGDAVFERETGAGRGLGAVRQHPPIAVRAAADFEGTEMQEMAVGRQNPDHRAQEFRIARDQRRGQEPFGDKPVRAVDISGDALQQFGALDKPLGDGLPFGVVNQHGDMRKRPVALRILLGAIGPVEHAGIAQVAVGAGEAVGEFRFVHAADGG